MWILKLLPVLAKLVQAIFWGHDLAIVHYNRGAAWSDKGDLDRAIADYTEAIRLDRANAYSLYGRGVAKLKKGDTAGGNADIAAAKAIKPDIAVVSAGYGITVDAAGANAAPEHK